MHILIIANNDVGLYKFRRELVEELLKKHQVSLCLPQGEYIPHLISMGCSYYECDINRHGTNPVAELKLISFFRSLLRRVKPDIVLTYTIKPNIYAGMLCAGMRIPYIVNITGLGIAVENGGLMREFLLFLYKLALRNSTKIFFQNESNCSFMLSRGVVGGPYEILPGSGVNLKEHVPEVYPATEDPLVFVTIGRMMKDKGIDEVLYAAKVIRKEFPNVVFRLIGSCDGDCEKQIIDASSDGIVEYFGHQGDVRSYLKEAHAIVHASYHEGMSNVLLEAAASARPIIATNVPGCREIYDDGVSGISCKACDGDDLARAIREFINLPHEKKISMGIAGRKKVEQYFNRDIVIEKYLKIIKEVGEEN